MEGVTIEKKKNAEELADEKLFFCVKSGEEVRT